ncbi:MAG: Asp-tRNA(Asn)/Glu-tRNA(Gln) amidotransferase subunit GatC [Patescibacteria group bacterium]
MIERDTVKKIAKLARLGLTEEEEAKFQKELSAILGFVDKLKEVDVEGVEPTAQVTGLNNLMRIDENIRRQPDSQQRLLANAPERKKDYIKVKAVFE